MDHPYGITMDEVRRTSAIIIPAYFHPGVQVTQVATLLGATLEATAAYVEPRNCIVVVDGCPASDEALERIGARAEGFTLCSGTVNMGKEHSVRTGMRVALERPELRYFCIRDADADALIGDFPRLVRLAHQVAVETGNERVLAIGRRHDLHRPMGFIRGEMELLVDRVVCDALRHRLARDGRVFDLRYCTAYADYPDIDSGYKAYTRRLAEECYFPAPALHCLSEHEFWRYGVEVYELVTGVLAGATVAEVARASFDEQPVSSFQAAGATLYEAQIAWVLAALAIDVRTAAALMDNHLHRLPACTDAAGLQVITGLRDGVMRRLAKHCGDPCALPPSPSRPRFF